LLQTVIARKLETTGHEVLKTIHTQRCQIEAGDGHLNAYGGDSLVDDDWRNFEFYL
jgi:hypothetical protein